MSYLVDQLKSISIDHGDSLRVLSAFVRQTREDIENSASTIESTLGKMPEIPESDGIKITVEETGAPVELTKKQYDMLRNTLLHSKTNAARFPNLLYEMAFIYRVALHDALIPDILTAILKNKQSMLKSKKTMTHEEIIDHPEGNSLVGVMAQKELDTEMSNKPIKVQLEYIKNKFGMELVKKQEHLDQLAELIARRHLLVHSNGRVDTKYKRLMPASAANQGERITVDYDYYEEAERLLTAIAEVLFTLTSKIHAKLEIPIIVYPGSRRIADLMKDVDLGRTE